MASGGSRKPATAVKVVTLGQSAAGKSSLVLRFVRDEFAENQESTIGAAFLTQTVALDNERSLRLEIWDTAGQERYRSLSPMYIRGSKIALIVYDITSTSTYEKAQAWVKDLERQADPSVVVCLVGTKLDLADRREVATETAQRYAGENGFQFFETSAKTGENIRPMFEAIAKKVPLDEPRATAARPAGGVELGRQSGANPSDGCAC